MYFLVQKGGGFCPILDISWLIWFLKSLLLHAMDINCYSCFCNHRRNSSLDIHNANSMVPLRTTQMPFEVCLSTIGIPILFGLSLVPQVFSRCLQGPCHLWWPVVAVYCHIWTTGSYGTLLRPPKGQVSILGRGMSSSKAFLIKGVAWDLNTSTWWNWGRDILIHLDNIVTQIHQLPGYHEVRRHCLLYINAPQVGYPWLALSSVTIRKPQNWQYG